MPKAKIDAIDLSRTSLGYAKRKAQEMKLGNIHFLHGDLLQVNKLNKQYDLVFSSGVLHHMADPHAGLEALLSVLKPKGAISISLYSEIGRRYLVSAQEWIIEQGYPVTNPGIRQFRSDIFSLPDDNPLKKVHFASDFYNMAECRDLLFHVQEYRFTCLDLKALLERHDLELLDFGMRALRAKKLYEEKYPDDPRGINLENWHEFEQEYPNTFARMYDLVLAKKGVYQEGYLPEWLRDIGIF